MIRLVALLVSILTIFTFGCNKTSFDDELQTIDSLEVSVDAVLQKVTEYDAELLATNADKAKQQLNFVAKNWTERDTLPRTAAAFLSDYKSNRKAMKFYSDQIKRTQDEANYTLSQLQKLRGDIQNDLFTKEEIQKFLSDEKQAVAVLVESDMALDTKYAKILNHHSELKVLVDSVILDMNQRGIR